MNRRMLQLVVAGMLPLMAARAADEAADVHRLRATQPWHSERPTVSLDGEWAYRQDRTWSGVEERWYADAVRFTNTIRVPGCQVAQGYKGLGDGWHKTTFTVPGAWGRQGRIWLHLGGAKPAAEVWVNGERVGASASSRVPLKADITPWVKWDATNTLTVRIFGPEMQLNGMWDYFSTQGIGQWFGMYRGVSLEWTGNAWIEALRVEPDMEGRQVRVEATVARQGAAPDRLGVRCAVTRAADGAPAGSASAPLSAFTGNAAGCGLTLPVPDLKPWSPDTPVLYRAEVSLRAGTAVVDTVSLRFGFRTISQKDGKVYLNGTPIFLRGGCDDQIYPETIAPPASKDFYIRRIELAKQYGFNYTKSCVEVFPHDFLEAADEVGYLVCQEMPFGLSAVQVGSKMTNFRSLKDDPPEAFARFWTQEMEHIVKADRHHPCVAIYSMASEMPIHLSSETSFRLFGQALPTLARQLNPRALVIDVTVGYGKTIDTRFGQRVTDIIEDSMGHIPFRNSKGERLARPMVLHEYQYWSSLPIISQKSRYQGLPVRPHGIEDLERAAERAGMTPLLDVFVRNSIALKYLLRKDGLEQARRLKGCAGYHHWLIHDFWDWCPEGVFNEFWEPPDDLPAAEFRMYNDDTVLLLADQGTRCARAGAALEWALEVSHYGPTPIRGGRLAWRVADRTNTVLEGAAGPLDLDCGDLKQVASVQGTLPAFDNGRELILSAELAGPEGAVINSNRWSLWCFPTVRLDLAGRTVLTDLESVRTLFPGTGPLEAGASIGQDVDGVVVQSLGRNILDYLAAGGRVVALSKGVLPEETGEKSSWFRTVLFNLGTNGNMGTVISPHPVLEGFPHDGWCSLQFYHLITGIYPMDLSVFAPHRIQPIIRSIGHQVSMRDKAYLFEAQVEAGRLLATSLDVAPGLGKRPEAEHLLAGLIRHLLSDTPTPTNRIPMDVLARAVAPPP